MKRDDDALLQSDEVLRALTHRAAYRALNFTRLIALPLSWVLIAFFQDSVWEVVGYTTFVYAFAISAVFEFILAYDGVFKGLDELRSSIVVSRLEVWRKVGTSALVFGTLMAVSYFVMSDEPSVVGSLIQGSVTAILFGSWQLYRLRHVIDTEKAR